VGKEIILLFTLIRVPANAFRIAHHNSGNSEVVKLLNGSPNGSVNVVFSLKFGLLVHFRELSTLLYPAFIEF